MRETTRLQEMLAKQLGGDGAEQEAHRLLAYLWGIGLYAFLSGEPVHINPSPPFARPIGGASESH